MSESNLDDIERGECDALIRPAPQPTDEDEVEEEREEPEPEPWPEIGQYYTPEHGE